MMDIIKPGDTLVKKILPCRFHQPLDQKQSLRIAQYCLSEEVEHGILLYNLLTKELLFLKHGELDINEDYLYQSGFLVDRNQNDFLLAKQVRNLIAVLRRKGAVLRNYTVFTTDCCNARCYYCFERNKNRIGDMTLSTAKQVADFVLAGGTGKVFFRWFGGEPLLNQQCITQICQVLSDQGVSFSSSMVSNGLLVDTGMIDLALSVWHLEKIQITLDGMGETYRKIKNFNSNVADPFHTVLDNIGLLLSNGIKVVIRLNLGLNNGDELLELINYIEEYYPEKKNICIRCHTLFEKEGGISHRRSSSQEARIRQKQLEILKKIDALQLYSVELERELKTAVCTADSGKVVTILPDGRVGLCEHQMGYDCIGDIYHPILNPIGTGKYSTPLPDREECTLCPMYLECCRQSVCDAVTEWCSEEKRKVMEYEIKMSMRYEWRKSRETRT